MFALHHRKQHALLLGLAALWLVLDQVIKHLVQLTMLPSQSIAFWPNVFHITYVFNTGAAFSMFEKHPDLLLWVTLGLFIVILLIACAKDRLSRLELLGFSLVLGGALGNIVDRLTLGKVVDYLDVIAIHYPVFNLADSFIFVGVCLLIIHQLKSPDVHITH